MDLHFTIQGRGRPVVLLHGMFASSASWQAITRDLSAGHRVLVPDLRNHGLSPAADSMTYCEMADDVFTLMQRERMGAATVVGHCIGGKVAMAMALTAPDKVRQLCVVETAPHTFLDSWSYQWRTMRRSLALNGGTAALDACLAASDGSLLNRFRLPRATFDNAYLDWRCNLLALGPLIPELREFPAELQDMRSDLVLHAILGADSPFVRPADPSVYLPMFPKVRMRSIGLANHWVHAAQPNALLAALREMLGLMLPVHADADA